jgi:hypothetical protein
MEMVNRNSAMTLQLQLSCRGLAKMDFLGMSDPYVEVHEYSALMDKYVKIGETEVLSKASVPDPHARECTWS